MKSPGFLVLFKRFFSAQKEQNNSPSLYLGDLLALYCIVCKIETTYVTTNVRKKQTVVRTFVPVYQNKQCWQQLSLWCPALPLAGLSVSFRHLLAAADAGLRLSLTSYCSRITATPGSFPFIFNEQCCVSPAPERSVSTACVSMLVCELAFFFLSPFVRSLKGLAYGLFMQVIPLKPESLSGGAGLQCACILYSHMI